MYKPERVDPDASANKKIIISGVGNELRQDDAFGVIVVQKLIEMNTLPDCVTIVETGTAGIGLVQELMDNYDALLLIDAVERDGKPGQLYLLEPEVSDINTFSLTVKSDFLADMHYTNPTRVLMLAKALNVLPERVNILGCQVVDYDDFAIGISDAVKHAIPRAIKRIDEWVVDVLAHKQFKENRQKIDDWRLTIDDL